MFKKITTGFLAVIILFVSAVGLIFPAGQAKAIPVEEIASVPQATQSVLSKIEKGLRVAVVNAVLRSFSYFMRKVAYDSAVWLASGGKGQSPMAQTSNFGDYITDVADNAAGIAIEELGTSYGVNLCKIPDVKVDIAMRIGLTRQFLRPGIEKPACTWSEFQKEWGWENWKSQYGSENIENRFNADFKIEESDLGISLQANDLVSKYIAKKLEGSVLERQEGQGYKPKTSLVSGKIITPAKNVAEEAQAQNPSKKAEQSEKAMGNVLASGSWETLVGAASLFMGTLGSELLRNYYEKGMFPWTKEEGGGGKSDMAANYESISTGGRQEAQQLFMDLLTPKTKEIDRYDVLSNLSNCPDSPTADNCVADENLVQAAREADYGKPVTIKEAIEKNWLHGDWKLIPPDRLVDNSDKFCYQRAYCFTNIAKLRKTRVLPLGFEIAAKNSNPDKPWTLKQVVDGFDDCNFIRDVNNKIVGVNNDPVNKPFCHLIDPNWVIKASPSKCNVMAYGSSLLYPGSPNRAEECVDMSTCVAYNSTGNCSIYGYCAREKNVWKMDAGACDAQYRTCRSFVDTAGKTVSYLYRTLDTGFCTIDNAGCAVYSLKKDYSASPAGNWTGFSMSDLLTLGENSQIHFNGKVSSNCSANSAGCSAFTVNNTADTLYLKKAPYYAKCYDSTPATPDTKWPQTVADLTQLRPKSECANYAQACIPDEVNCNWYEPITYQGDRIPGKYTPAKVVEDQIVWNDQCDQRCVGYAAYKEMPSNYSGGQDVAYIIPSSGNACSAQEEGCASFTNLSATEGGMEKVEYFSYLRPCIAPDASKQKTFYTYEGSVAGGYQLKSFVLEKETDSASPDFGSPKYFYRTPAERTDYDAVCSPELYTAGLASLDCRQFNDEQGRTYYKLLSKTIAVSQSCTPYRLNDTELATDGACFQNGELRDGSCFYFGLAAGVPNNAGVSQSCSASVNSCRAYKGNAGNNIRTVFYDNFENSSTTLALENWSAGSLSGESTHAGEHSLYSGAGSLSKSLSLVPGKSYDLTFWAKGSLGAALNVELNNGAHTSVGTVSIGDTWQYYHLGPVELGGSATGTALNFIISGGGGGSALFLDNVKLVEVIDYIYLVKNTLKVDRVCDSNPDDNLPGLALGCALYKTPDGSEISLTGFSYLCREGAIGCAALLDTHNTLNSAGPSAYNVWLPGTGGTQARKVINSREYICDAPKGESGCYVNIEGVELSDLASENIVESTVFIPKDTPTSTPIYLVANKETSCSSVDLGCVKAGRKAETPSGPKYEDVVIKNDPASYASTLCQKEAVGCNVYNSGNGIMYFKDPAVTGQKICAYRQNVTKSDGVKYGGWFWKGVGICINTSTFARGGNCNTDSDCASPPPAGGGAGGGGSVCSEKDEQACYPSYIETGNKYGLWSYGTKDKYENFVGECPQEQNGCTEFIDHHDSDKPFYLIDGDDLQNKQAECNGQVSEKSGCILLDRTDRPNKLWNTELTYDKSESLNGALVAPESNNANNANIILKVTRDRECGEWLQCRSSHRVWDATTGKYKEVCDMIGRCDKATQAPDKSDITNCENWIDGIHETADTVLTEEVYRDRDTGWKGLDFAGYSLLNMYPIEEFQQVDLKMDEPKADFVVTSIGFNTRNKGSSEPDWHLVKTVPCGGNNCLNSAVPASPACTGSASCGKNNSGVCINGMCVKNLDGSSENLKDKTPSQICRAYPEESSPFPYTGSVVNSQQYTGVNFCEDSIGPLEKDYANSCECGYKKVNYGDLFTKYWGYNSNYASNGLCSGGTKNGKTCYNDSDCAVGGTCQLKTREDRFIGWRGYCLEPDLSRTIGDSDTHPCLTWYPVDKISGAPDINSLHVEAGFNFNDFGGFGKYYCLRSEGHITKEHFDTCAFQNVPGCVGDRYLEDAPIVTNQVFTSDGDKVISGNYYLGGQNIKQNDLDYIKFQIQGNNTNWGGRRSFFYIRNGLITEYNIQSNQTTIYKPGVSGKKEQLYQNSYLLPLETYLSGTFKATTDGASREAWAYRYDDGGGDALAVKFIDAPGVLGQSYADLLNLDSAALTTRHSDDDGCAIKVEFEGAYTDKRIKNIYFACYSQSGSDTVTINVFAGYREPCTYIASTGNNSEDTTGWTDRLWKNSKAGYVVPDLGYNFYEKSNPFGSLGINYAPGKTPVSIRYVFTPEANPSMPIPVLGVPYSCEGTCAKYVIARDSSGNEYNVLSPRPASLKTLNEGAGYFTNLFASIYGVYWWSGSTAYQFTKGSDLRSILPLPLDNYNKTEAATNINNAPVVLSLSACQGVEEKCMEGSAGITVNGVTSGNIVMPTRLAPVNIKFFAYADKNQMPVKKLTVDWGDDTNVALDGLFRNHRGQTNGTCFEASGKKTCRITVDGAPVDTGKVCSQDKDCQYLDSCLPENKAPDFGRIVDKSCDNAYYRFDHVYQCTDGGVGWKSGTACPNTDMRADYGGCCVFKPKVQVKDNWGWCNGSCPCVSKKVGDVWMFCVLPDNTPGGVGCYDKSWEVGPPRGVNECGNGSGAYTLFNGNVIVAPQ